MGTNVLFTTKAEYSPRDTSLQHLKHRIAVELCCGRCDLYCARGRAGRNRRFDVGIGLYRKLSRHSVEGDAGRSGQIVAEDDDVPPDFASHRHGFDHRAEAVRELEGGAITKVAGATLAAAYAAVRSGPVEIAIGRLKNRVNRSEATRTTTEAVERLKLARRSDLVNASPCEGSPRPGPASNKGSIEIAVAGQRQCGSGPPHARRFAREPGKFRVITCRCDLECASISCAIKIPIRALPYRVRPRIITLGTTHHPQ